MPPVEIAGWSSAPLQSVSFAPYRPHVTLGRVREGHRLPPGAVESYQVPGERAAFLAEELVLYESVLTSDGPRYQPRLALPLQA
jgi:2'-5' RNA ligase